MIAPVRAEPPTAEASSTRGCLVAILAIGALIACVVVGVVVAIRVYTHHGAGDARASFLRQRSTIYSAIRAIPLPPENEREGFGMGDDVVMPFDASDAEKGYELARNPLGSLAELFCADVCASRWRPSDGVSVRRQRQAPSTSPADVCDLERSLIAASPLAADVSPAQVAPEHRGVACGFAGTYRRAVFLTIQVLSGSDAHTPLIHVTGATRKESCYSDLAEPPLRPTCAPGASPPKR